MDQTSPLKARKEAEKQAKKEKKCMKQYEKCEQKQVCLPVLDFLTAFS